MIPGYTPAHEDPHHLTKRTKSAAVKQPKREFTLKLHIQIFSSYMYTIAIYIAIDYPVYSWFHESGSFHYLSIRSLSTQAAEGTVFRKHTAYVCQVSSFYSNKC